VVGVDINPQPHYPFEFHQADALTYSLEGFDAYHASPQCQKWTWAAKRWHKDWPDNITPIRTRLEKTGQPFIIENVPQSPLNNPLKLKGTMFDLRVIRERWFEVYGFELFMLYSPVLPRNPIASGEYQTVVGHGGNSKDCRLTTWQKCMGIDWMAKEELVQAIPPAYTEYIGKYLMQAVLEG
jgi:DNA (cytosine-5)-methyltransferase 1